MTKREIFYDKYKDWKVDQFKNIFFTDESKICLEPSRIKYWMT